MNQKIEKIFKFAFPKAVEAGKKNLGKRIDDSEAYIKKTLPILLTMTAAIYLQNNYMGRSGKKEAELPEVEHE